MNAALMRLRKEKKARTLTQTGLDDLEIPDWSEAPDWHASNSELGDRLRKGVEMLPPDLKAAVVLRDVEGLSNSEAAEVLGVRVPALKSRLHRGRVLLRKHSGRVPASGGLKVDGMLRDVPLVFPISLAIIVVMLFFTGAYAISENALEGEQAASGQVDAAVAPEGQEWLEQAAIFVCPLH